MPGKPLYIVTYYHEDEERGWYTGDYFGPASLEMCKNHILDIYDQFFNVESVHFYEIREVDVTWNEEDIHE